MRITDEQAMNGLIEFITRKRYFHILNEKEIIKFMWDEYQVSSDETNKFLEGFFRRMESEGKMKVYIPWRVTIQRILGIIKWKF